MNANLKAAIRFTVIWADIYWLAMPSVLHRMAGRHSMIRFDPKVSRDYNCIFVEAHSQPSFEIPWLMRSTPTQYLRIRYTPLDGDQPYGIMFVDPRTLAVEPHVGWSKKPERMSVRLDSPKEILDWMRSQPKSGGDVSHEADAKEIFDAITVLAPSDLEHFSLPPDLALTHFAVGHSSKANRDLPHWPIFLLPLIPIWCRVFAKGQSKVQTPESPAKSSR